MHIRDGYLADVEDQSKRLKDFKLKYSAQLEEAAAARISQDDVMLHFRRLDSMARLLEGKAICAAVYYDEVNNELLLANNQVHAKSKLGNKHFLYLNEVFDLISDESISVDTIIDKLSDIITLNISQGQRFALAGTQIKKIIAGLLEELLRANQVTKEWRDATIESYPYGPDAPEALTREIIKKTARLTRDFLKLRDYLLKSFKDPLSLGLLKAIKERKFRILHEEGLGVHAEMRIAAKLVHKPGAYIGISKLCCDHCTLVLKNFDISSRGTHGQRGRWPTPDFLVNNADYFSRYLGVEAARIYKTLSLQNKTLAKKFTEEKESNSVNENARHGRHMEADSSESDNGFGVNLSDEDQISDIREFPLNKIWRLRHINRFFNEEFENLKSMRIPLNTILELHEESIEKFEHLASAKTTSLVNSLAAEEDYSTEELFEKLMRIYEDEDLFFSLIHEDSDRICRFGLDDIQDEYTKLKNARPSRDDSDYENESVDICSIAIANLERENGASSRNSNNSYDSDRSGRSSSTSYVSARFESGEDEAGIYYDTFELEEEVERLRM